MKTEALYFPETSVLTYQTSLYHSPKDGNIILCPSMNFKSLSFILYPDRVHKVFDLRTDGHDPPYSVFISPPPYPERTIIVIGSEFHKNSPSLTERVSWVEIAVKFALSALSPSIPVYYHRMPVFVHIPLVLSADLLFHLSFY
jgi:hypothetical protein